MDSGRERQDRAGLEREIAAWLETLAVETSQTLRQSPTSTIVPTEARASTGGSRALAALEQLAGRSPIASEQLRPGKTIGEGGMGIVRLAEQVALGRTVAVKTLKPGRRDPSAALDLLREAWVTGTLEHPNIVPVHHLGLDEDGNPLIVLKRIEGVEWHELIEDAAAVAERFGATDLLAWNLGILIQVLNALRFAHSRGILHRDVKPTNVMIGAFGEVYLLDWGIAVSLHDDGSGRLPLAQSATEMAGTPCYMAPEMLGRENSVLSERTDVYLAGAVLFEIITGGPPHTGDSAAEVLASVMMSSPEIPAGTPHELGRICLRALHRDPEARFPSAEALQQALQEFLERRGSARLAELAGERLAELRRVLAGADAARDHVYRLFGACRFGFHEALVAWRDNSDARAGLDQAITAVAEYEIAHDDPRAALTLLGELDAPPPELLARARAAAAAKHERQAALEKLEALHDVAIGTRTRTFLTTILGVIFTAAPLLAQWGPSSWSPHTHRNLIIWGVGFLALIFGMGVWARESLMKTIINRRLFVTALFLFVAQIVLAVGGMEIGLTVVQTEHMMMFLWIVISTMCAIGIDRRLAPSAVAYAIGFIVAARFPDQRYLVMAVCNAAFTVNAVWHWKPDHFILTPEEWAEWKRRKR